MISRSQSLRQIWDLNPGNLDSKVRLLINMRTSFWPEVRLCVGKVSCRCLINESWAWGGWNSMSFDAMTFNTLLLSLRCGLQAVTWDSAPKEEACLRLFLQQFYSAAPRAGPGTVLAWFPKTPLPRGVRLVRVSAAGPQTEEHGACQILK